MLLKIVTTCTYFSPFLMNKIVKIRHQRLHDKFVKNCSFIIFVCQGYLFCARHVFVCQWYLFCARHVFVCQGYLFCAPHVFVCQLQEKSGGPCINKTYMHSLQKGPGKLPQRLALLHVLQTTSIDIKFSDNIVYIYAYVLLLQESIHVFNTTMDGLGQVLDLLSQDLRP